MRWRKWWTSRNL